jgi:DNA-binding HxlR family transcriptional regulator
MSDKLVFLQKAGSAEILTTLLDQNDKMYFTELKTKIGRGSMTTFATRVLELEKYGLIKFEMEKKYGRKRYIWITEKGKKIAKHLKEIEKLM